MWLPQLSVSKDKRATKQHKDGRAADSRGRRAIKKLMNKLVGDRLARQAEFGTVPSPVGLAHPPDDREILPLKAGVVGPTS